ncbi:MAG: limonene-1,2-epoxide hydrolase family protein [Gammaproteobacteria bacterium]|jgi:limonene-1,2-epoxide hydrolase|nr:limonene-1,2-epoxide hydrolase family protein [Gammaproteobacteria bacterium]
MKKSINLLTLVFIIGFGFITQSSAQSEAANMSQNESIVREFIAAWSNLDPVELASYFTEDGTYHNMPSGATTGRDNIQQFIAGFSRSWESTDWEIISLVADGDMVIVERLDKTVVAGSPVNLPCVGIYEMENGKIKMWRDYFDLATYTNALTAALNQAPQ